MVKGVKRKSNGAEASGSQVSGSGRVAQRSRTRKAIVDAAMQLMAAGGMPSIVEVAEAAQVSRRTIYMYFPTLEQLLLDATLGALSKEVQPVVDASAVGDPATRIELLSRAVNNLSGKTMHLGRALIRLTVESDEPPTGVPRRGYRRVEWIERTLAPVRNELSRKEFERLVSALTVLIGWEALIILRDLRGLGQKESEDVLASAARAVVDNALGKAVR